MPVNTIAMPRSSAAAITSSSRMLPPGWITAVAPSSATTSRPSRNGKNASDATTEPASERPAFAALIAAMRAESTRLIWPAPTPSVRPVAAIHDRVGFHELGHAPGEQQVARLLRRRRALGHDLELGVARRCASSGVCTSKPPPTRFMSHALPRRGRSRSGTSSTRTFPSCAITASASSVYAGAISTSTNCSATASTVAASSGG